MGTPEMHPFTPSVPLIFKSQKVVTFAPPFLNKNGKSKFTLLLDSRMRVS